MVLIKILDTILHFIFQPPSNEPHNTNPYYPPYSHPPPTFQNYFFSASNSTPSSTPTAFMVAFELSSTDINLSTDEPDVEEIRGGIAIPSKKWSIEEDQLLISDWINYGTDPTVGTGQKGRAPGAR